MAFSIQVFKPALQDGEREKKNKTYIMERSAVLQRKRNSGGGKIYLTEYVAKALKLKYRKVLHTKETKDLRFCSWLSNSEKIIKRNKIKDMT